ncbi:MAG: helix-turn-helix transcriptional regulator [Myxococcaceae bacterium]|jgi:transcriptional regulator with XRE-family HTH domain|nr:helix-turn-helix transcriptional regulator [Myxococcaceae bacterium]
MELFPELLKSWRKQRRFSQLALALEANVSARHLAYLETGRARPSAEMVNRLGEALGLPLSARNQLLARAGFAARYERRAWDDPQLEPVRRAVAWTLERHSPWPGLAVDRLWRVVRFNAPAHVLFGQLGVEEGASLLDFLVSARARAVIENWPQVAHQAALRLRTESTAQGGVAELDRFAQQLAAVSLPEGDGGGPLIVTRFRLGDACVSLFATVGQFGSPEDLTLDDLRLELFFPADDASERVLRDLGSGAERPGRQKHEGPAGP